MNSHFINTLKKSWFIHFIDSPSHDALYPRTGAHALIKSSDNLHHIIFICVETYPRRMPASIENSIKLVVCLYVSRLT